MKKYIDQIYYEGLGKTIYVPVEKIINKIKNESVRKVFTFIVMCLYFVLAIFIAVMLFYFIV